MTSCEIKKEGKTMSGKPIKNHFVPQVYLKSWENGEKQLWIYDIQEDKPLCCNR